MRRSGIAISLNMLLALAGGAAGAEDPVPGTKSEIVRLDVVVTDAQGTPVRDLTREDFRLLEDGKPQRLTHFTAADWRGSPSRSEDEAEAVPEAPAAGEGRQIVVFVDDLHMQVESVVFAKEALLRFVDEFLVANDNVALVTASGGAASHQLTRDRAILRQMINRLVLREATVLPGQSTQMTPAQAEMILRGDSGALRLAARTLMDSPGSGFSAGDPNRIGATRLIMGAGEPEERGAAAEAERQARGILVDALRFSSVTLQRLDDIVRGLSSLPGRKICLLVSDGFLVGAGTSEERTRDMQGVVDAATRAGAVVYALDSRGLVTRGPDAGVGGPSTRPDARFGVDRRAEQLFRDTLETLSLDTGGFLVRGTNDLAGGLRRMLGDNESYYLMAYEPTNTKHDGRFRKIEVRLARGDGYVVRTRKGYLAPDDRKEARQAARLAATMPPLGMDEGEVRAVLGAPRPPGDIPVHLTADYLELPPTGPQAVVRAHVDLSALRWQEVAGRRQAAFDAWGGVFDANGRAIGEPFGRHSDLDLTKEQHRVAIREGFQYQQQVTLPPGRYEIRFVAAESQAGRLAGSSQWLDIPDLGQKKLAMSSVFLSSAGNGGQNVAGGEALHAVPALRRFKHDESVYFQVYLYNPAVDEKGSSDVVLQAQIWSGGKVIAASKPRPAALERKEGVPVPETNGMSLQGLAPGDYNLKVVVVDRKADATITGSVDLTVE
jgi:VWFA-related protein